MYNGHSAILYYTYIYIYTECILHWPRQCQYNDGVDFELDEDMGAREREREYIYIYIYMILFTYMYIYIVYTCVYIYIYTYI